MVWLLALAALIASTSNAHAMAFLIAPIVAAVGITGVAATVATAVLGTALAVGVSYAASKLLAPSQPKKVKPSPGRIESGAPSTSSASVGGVQLDIRADVDVPQSLIVGRAVTAGSLVYAETYGQRGDIDNSDLIEIIALADHPCQGLVQVFVESQAVTLSGEDVSGYSGKLQVKFYDGTQTTADTLTVNAFVTQADRPWETTMVGRGITYARTHYIYDPDLVPGRLAWRFVIDGIKLYDPRKDSTVGGSGAHRFDVLSTHEWTANLAVIAYNILRGIRVADSTGTARHFYGIEGTPASSLPLDVWFAAMNECDLTVDGEPQFHGGAEIPVSTEPLDTVQEILKSCDGRLVEIGGIYKLYVGPPGLPAVSFDDGVLRADDGDSFHPILPLEQRINYVTGTYTRPEDGWVSRVAPPRGDAAAESRDGRRVSADLNVPWVQSGNHIQRLQKQMLAKARKERRHQIPLPPSVWGLEPGDVVEWTSDRNGYVAKLFEIDAVEDLLDLSSIVSFTEIDETDYDWNAGADLIPEADGSLGVTRPAAKVITGFAAEGIAQAGTNGTVRPAIRVSWDDPLDADVTTVRVHYRLASAPTDIATAFSDDPPSGALIIANLQPLTNYEVRAQFESFNGWATQASSWIPVITPAAYLSQADLDALLNARISQLDRSAEASISRALDAVYGDIDSLAHKVMGLTGNLDQQDQIQQAATGAKVLQLNEQLVTETEARAAAITSVEAALADTNNNVVGVSTVVDGLVSDVQTVGNSVDALATRFITVFAQNANGIAEAMFRVTADAAPTGVAARVAIEAKTEAGVYGSLSAGLYLDVVAGIGTRVAIIADRFLVQTATGFAPVFSVAADVVSIATNVQISGNLLVDGTIGGTKIADGAISAAKISAGAITADKIAANSITAANIIAGTVTADRFVTAGMTAPNAVSNPSFTLSTPGGGTGWVTIAQLSAVIDNGVLAIQVLGQVSGTLSFQGSAGGYLRMRVLCGGVQLAFPSAFETKSPGSYQAGFPVSIGRPKSDVPNGTQVVAIQMELVCVGSPLASFNGSLNLFVMTPRA